MSKEKKTIIMLCVSLVFILILFLINTFGVNILEKLETEKLAREQRISQQATEEAERLRLEEEEQKRMEAEKQQELEEIRKLEEEKQKRVNDIRENEELLREEVIRILDGIAVNEENNLKIKLANNELAIQAIKNIETTTAYQAWFKEMLLSDDVELSKIVIADTAMISNSTRTIFEHVYYIKYNNDVETTYDILSTNTIYDSKFKQRGISDTVGKEAIMCKSTYVIDVPDEYKEEFNQRNACGIFAIVILD